MTTLGLNVNMNFSSDEDSFNKQISEQLAISGTAISSGRITIGTTEETLPLGDVSSVGVVVIKNLDDTNFLEHSTTTGQRNHKITPGMFAIVQAKNNNVYVKADTAPVEIFYWIFSV